MRWFGAVLLMSLVACGSGPPRGTPPVSGAPTASALAPAKPRPRHAELVELLDGYRMDDGPPGEQETKVVAAVLALTDAHTEAPLSREERQAVFELFLRTRGSFAKARHENLYLVLSRAMVAISDSSWEDKLIELIDQPIASAQAQHVDALLDQVLWQVTACEVLGQLRSTKAIESLIKVTLSPFKGNVAGTAQAALLRIGAPAITALTEMLDGKAPALVAYAESELLRAARDQGETVDAKARVEAKSAHLDPAIQLLGDFGTSAAAVWLMAQLDSPVKSTRQRVAVELPNLPRTAAIVPAFKRIYLETSVADRLGNGDYAKEALIAAAATLYEPGLAAWIIDDALKLQGNDEDVVGVQASVLSYGFREIKKDGWPKLEQLYARVMKHTKKAATYKEEDWAPYERAYAVTKALLDRCGDEAACYRRELDKPNLPEMGGIRAATMAMLLGGPGSQSVTLALASPTPDIRAILFRAFLAFSPRGDIAAADAIEAAVLEATRSRDEQRIFALRSYGLVALILRARAAP